MMAIVALSTTVWRLWSEVEPLRIENKRLNEERGTLVIEDRSKLQAIRIPANFAGEGRDSFRIFVPEGSLYWAFVMVNEVPKEGYPPLKRFPEKYSALGSGTDLLLHARLPPGEHILTLKPTERANGCRDFVLVVDHLDASANTAADRWPTMVPETCRLFGDELHHQTTLADDQGRLALLRRRVLGVTRESLNVSYVAVEPDYPLDGIMLWIEPDRNAK